MNSFSTFCSVASGIAWGYFKILHTQRTYKYIEEIKSYFWNKILVLFKKYCGKNKRKFVQQITTCIGQVRVRTGRFDSFVELFLPVSFHLFPYKYFQHEEFQRIYCFPAYTWQKKFNCLNKNAHFLIFVSKKTKKNNNNFLVITHTGI
jgi:hypothetical protein